MSSSSSSQALAGSGRRIELKRYSQSQFTFGDTTGFRIRVEVTLSHEMDPKIFRYYRMPANLSGERKDVFSGVCSGTEMEDLPEDAPGDLDMTQQFRAGLVDLVVPSQQLADEVWDILQDEVASLVRTLNAADSLILDETAIIGGD